MTYSERSGLAAAIRAHAQHGTSVVGLCAGYQMLGTVIRDPLHVESERDDIAGLNLLPIETIFETEKATEQVSAQVVAGCGFLQGLRDQTIQGYEIHMGRTSGQLGNQACLPLTPRLPAGGDRVRFRERGEQLEAQQRACRLRNLLDGAGIVETIGLDPLPQTVVR